MCLFLKAVPINCSTYNSWTVREMFYYLEIQVKIITRYNLNTALNEITVLYKLESYEGSPYVIIASGLLSIIYKTSQVFFVTYSHHRTVVTGSWKPGRNWFKGVSTNVY